MKSKNISIACLVIFVITIITVISMFCCKKPETTSRQYSFTTDNNDLNLTSCSATTCGMAGTQYRQFKCDGPSGPVDPALCFANASSIMYTSCVGLTGACQRENNGSLQDCHYLLKGVLNKTSLLGGGYLSGQDNTQITKYETPGSLLRLPVATEQLNGLSTPSLNTVIFPAGKFLGTYLIMLFYPQLSTTTSRDVNMTTTTGSQSSIYVDPGYFKGPTDLTSVLSNMSNVSSSKKLFFYIVPVTIVDDTVDSQITFSCGYSFTVKPNTYADLFVIQTSSVTSKCGNITGRQIGNMGPNCYLGNSPLMARYHITGGISASSPFGDAMTNNTIYNEGIQISDSIGLTFSKSSSVVTVKIPAVLGYTQYPTGTIINYLIILQWGTASIAIAPSVAFTGNTVTGDEGDYSSLKPFSYTNDMVGSEMITNKGDYTNSLIYCQTLKLAVNKTSSFSISNFVRPNGAACSCNLLIVQCNENLQ